MKKIKFGCVFKIRLKEGFGYFLYTHEFRGYGSLIHIINGVRSDRDLEAQVFNDESIQFSTFFPLKYALSNGLVDFVGEIEVPTNLKKFPVFRSAGHIDKSGNVQYWRLWNGEDGLKIGKELTCEQKRMPILQVLNDTALKDFIESGWVSADRF